MQSLISPENTWVLWAVILTGTALSIYLEKTYRWGARLSGPVIGILLAMVLSNTGIMPVESKTYDVVSGYLVPLAIPMLLFRAHLGRILKATGRLFLAFHLAALGTVIGAFLAVWMLQGSIERSPELAGIMSGSYIGGMVNFVAIQNSFGITGAQANPLLVADNIIMAAAFLLIFLISTSRFFLARYLHDEWEPQDLNQTQGRHLESQPLHLMDLAKAVAISVVIVTVARLTSNWVSARVPWENWKSLFGNFFLYITLFSVLAATLFSKVLDKIQGADQLGLYLLYIFLFVIGFPADFREVAKDIPLLFVFCTIMAVSNIVVALVLGKLFKFKLEEILLSINATLGGPPTAAAMAISKHWNTLVLPALLIGLWGYIIGTPVGLLVAKILSYL